MLPTLYDGRTTHGRLVLDRIGADYGVAVLRAADPASRSGSPRRRPPDARWSGTGRTSKGAEAYRAVATTLADRLRPT